MTFAVSVIDFGAPLHTLELAPVAEECGYFRYWLGEHHSPRQASNPLLRNQAQAFGLVGAGAVQPSA